MGAKYWMGMALAACAGLALARSPGPDVVRKQTEASVLVSGTIAIEPDGHVGGYRLDQAEQIPAAATRLIDRIVPTWKFQPVVINGTAVKAQTNMTLRIVAQPIDGTRAEVRIASASFSGGEKPGESPTGKELKPPRYPEDAASYGVKGTVYLVVRVGRDGAVEDAIVEQVNLRVVDSQAGMERWRDTLAKAALAGARRWTFNPPIAGDEADEPFWLVRVPVDFALIGEKPPAYGQWEAYVPGPRHSTPWPGALDTSLGADAVAAGGVHPIGSGPKLLTPLDGT